MVTGARQAPLCGMCPVNATLEKGDKGLSSEESSHDGEKAQNHLMRS